jgi:hypothetical protein
MVDWQPTSEQVALLRTIWEQATRQGIRPTWDYVERELHRVTGLDARAVLASLPVVRPPL